MGKRTKFTKKTDSNKAWNRKKVSKTPYNLSRKTIAKSFYIVCEGVNTEPAYFKSFPVGNAHIQAFGMGQSKTSLVKEVLKMIKTDSSLKSHELWVVFDMDINLIESISQKEDYNKAILLATKNKIKVAYSNDSFELWFILHYIPLATKWIRHEYYQKLSELWGCNYEKMGKNYGFCRGIYKKLRDDDNASQKQAIKRSLRLFEEQLDLPFCERNPCNTVFELVSELNFYL